MNEAFFKSPRGSFGFGFAVNPLDRVSEKREDEAFLGHVVLRSGQEPVLERWS